MHPGIIRNLIMVALFTLAGARADYFLKDGDKVAFLGDSITAARGYPKIVEHYTLMRFPDRRVGFVNAGQGGDTASGSLKRLERDVFANQPTVVIVAFGINDIGWGTKADQAHKQLYLDGVHLSELGQLALAYVMLKGLGAPEEISSAVIDASSGAASKSDGCRISNIKMLPDGIAFTRLDDGLPLNLGPLSGLQYGWIPVPDGINGYRLSIQNLADGDYTIHCGGRDLGRTTADALGKGINISAMTADGWQPGGPWDAQSNVVKSLVDARDQLWMAGKQQREFLPEDPAQASLLAAISKMDHDLVDLQRNAARPYPYPFEIRRVAP